jgi:hypothetical protein
MISPAGIVVPNVATSGGSAVTLLGYNFGTVNTSPTVKLGATECVESTWKSNEVMMCKSAVGTSAALNVLVTVDQNPGLTSKFLT